MRLNVTNCLKVKADQLFLTIALSQQKMTGKQHAASVSDVKYLVLNFMCTCHSGKLIVEPCSYYIVNNTLMEYQYCVY